MKTDRYQSTKCNQYGSPPTNENVNPNTCRQKIQSSTIKTNSELSRLLRTIQPPSNPTTRQNSPLRPMTILNEMSCQHNKYIEMEIGDLRGKGISQIVQIYCGRKLSRQEVIQKCFETQISRKQEAFDLIMGIQLSNHINWPLTTQSLLLTDLGQLLIEQLCQNIISKKQGQFQCDHENDPHQLIEFLLSQMRCQNCEITVELIETIYQQYRLLNQQSEMIMKNLTLRCKKQIFSKINGKKQAQFEKSIQSYIKKHKYKCERFTYDQFRQIFEPLSLNEEHLCLSYKYLLAVEHGKCPQLIDRKSTVLTSLILKHFTSKDPSFFLNKKVTQTNTSSVVELMQQQNRQIIKQLLIEKNQMLIDISQKNSLIQKLQKSLHLQELQSQRQRQEDQKIFETQRQADKKKHYQQIKSLKEDHEQKDNLIKWYQNEIEAIVNLNQIENLDRDRIFKAIAKKKVKQLQL